MIPGLLMLAGGASAFADANELELEHSRREQELTQRKFAYLCKEVVQH